MSMLEIRACARSLRRNATCSAPGTMRSAVNAPCPVSKRRSSTRLTGAPMYFGRSPKTISALANPNVRSQSSDMAVRLTQCGRYVSSGLRIILMPYASINRHFDRELHSIAGVPCVANDNPRSTVISCIFRARPGSSARALLECPEIGRGNAMGQVPIVICRCGSRPGAGSGSDAGNSLANSRSAPPRRWFTMFRAPVRSVVP